MKPYVITTDSCADLPESWLQKHEVRMVWLSCLLDGEVYNDTNPLSAEELYAKLREGAMPTTSQVNPDQARAMFEPILKEGKDILHIAFSSGLSGSCQSAVIAAGELMEEYPERKIIVVDSLMAASGQGLLVCRAVQTKEDGMSLDDLAAWCEENKGNVAAYVLVDDLFHLQRGGRVSKSSAILGSMVGIKPILRVDEDGKLEVIGKIRGRKKAIQTILEKITSNIQEGETTIFISHGDCLEEAEQMRSRLVEEYGIQETMVNVLGPVIGAHTGAGMLAIFAFCNDRK